MQPSGLVGRTFLVDEKEDGSRFCACIVECLQDQDNELPSCEWFLTLELFLPAFAVSLTHCPVACGSQQHRRVEAVLMMMNDEVKFYGHSAAVLQR
jgi:hypothetical protein